MIFDDNNTTVLLSDVHYNTTMLYRKRVDSGPPLHIDYTTSTRKYNNNNNNNNNITD